MSAIVEHYLDGLLDAAKAAPDVIIATAPAAAVPAESRNSPARQPPPVPETTASASASASAVDATRWLIFHLGGQCYALQVSQLQEVLAWQILTPVPCAPPRVLGLIHRRGAVMPVMDIRHTLGLGVAAPTPSGALVLLPAGLAVAVDAIGDVFMPGTDVQPPPSVGTPIPAVRALARHDRHIVVLLDGTALLP